MSKIGSCWLAIFSCLCFACSWVDDDLSDCPSGFWLKLSYKYNMLNVDAAFTQLKNASIFIFDETGNYIETQHVDSLTLHQNSCLVRLESLSTGKYNFLVWSGLTDS
ncbi:MAG TPA: FimB/Mfa2 family fimbrial subunit, partial [Candidatus Butyricimonas faecavium]|nr:FimB/Mfa2 family fimbrial subunit [Candidatus Butyricimonas faecavium]